MATMKETREVVLESDFYRMIDALQTMGPVACDSRPSKRDPDWSARFWTVDASGLVFTVGAEFDEDGEFCRGLAVVRTSQADRISRKAAQAFLTLAN
jgi:hypothetical protein